MKRRTRNLERARRYGSHTRASGRTEELRTRRLRHVVPVLLMTLVLVGVFQSPEAVGLPGVAALEGETTPETMRGEAALRALSQRLGGAQASQDAPRPAAAGDTSGGTGGPGPREETTPAGAEATATAAATSQAIEQEPPPVLREYEVQPGDTASGIAEQFGISTDYILWNNVNVIDDADSLQVGATLQIPGVEGIIHSARVGDTASALAVEYDSTTQAIVEFEANGFGGDPNNLPIGALILVPDGRRIPPPPPEEPPASDPAPSWTPPPPAAPPAPTWTWPAGGRLTNAFTPRHPLGIDISMVVNTPIAAAMSGTVTFIGGNPCCSYGYHVIIDHGDGHETLYAHLSQFHVSAGQWVNAGDLIASSGNTGYSTGPHLHFEVRNGGTYVNPLGYLP